MLISNTKKRKGMILLVVVAFLAMFTVMGLTYLLHADNQLKNSIDELLALDIKEDPHKVIDLKPSVVLDFFLEKFLYDQADSTTGGNAIRGQSLARNIYGGYVLGALNDKAFSGIGKLNKDFIIAGSTIKEWQMVNYSFSNALNPERLSDGGSGIKTSTWNAPYTYPDHNNFYLGWLKSDGTKVIPSFHRDYIFGSMAAPFTNANWTNIKGKYLTPRPRPNEHPNFPYPEADGMDVKNLEGYPGGNDSIWIDVGSPVFTALDGRKYKIMVAPLILDLDGRINVNVAGNVMGAGNTNASNQGWGPWEVNLSTALGGTANAITEAQQINKGYSAGGALLLPGVYGTTGIPGGSTLPMISAASPWGTNAPTPHPYLTPTYAMIDFNAKSETGVANSPITLSNSFASFPTFSGNYTSNVVAANEIGIGVGGIGHPSFVNPQRTKAGNSKFTNNEMASLIRWSGQGSAPKATNLVNLLKNTLGADYIYDNSTIAIRNRITTLSADIQQSTLLPYSYTLKPTLPATPVSPYVSNFGYGKYPESDIATNPKNLPYPLGTSLPFADLNTNLVLGTKSDFPSGANLVTGVSPIVGYMNQINLNRTLTKYPDINYTLTGGVGGGGGRYLNNTGYATAVSDRQNFATEIFNGLKLATGVEASDFEANRYLAQIAVNMVDYIDYDDVMTEFIWKYDPDPTKYERVYGVELNKVVLNEVYAEIINDPTDKFPETPAGSNKFPANTPTVPPIDRPFQVHFWVELMNPLPAATVPGSLVNHAILEQDPRGAAGDSSVYQLEIRDQSAVIDIFKFDNPLGVTRPDATGNDRRKGLVTNFQPAVAGGAGVNLLAPAAGNYLGTENAANGFIVLGSNTPFPNSGPLPADMPMPYSDINNIANIKKNELKYTIAIPDPAYNKAKFSTSSTPLQTTHKPSIVLRRLANPYMPPQIDPTQPDYNPYVTVDVMNDIRVNDAVTNASDDKKAAPPNVENRSSVVRQQPYQEAVKKDVGANLANPLVKQPQHTFLRHNGTTITAPPVVPLGAASTDTMLKLPFKWLMHLDRKLINSLEILNISGCKPSEVTQRFSNPIYVDSNNIKIENKAPWLDEASNLYRFLALADVQGYQQGTAFAGRQIGKININNIWDKEVFNALCDANTNNNFTQAEVDTVFTNFLNSRSPSSEPRPNTLAPMDNPIWGFGLGNSAGNDNWTGAPRGICNSFFRLNTLPLVGNAPTSVFDLPNKDNSTPPVEIRNGFQQKELLSKIYNNLTTKSNVFGVWVTTGYFEVTDDTTNPPTLGAEIGKIAGRNIRHRMFAIVDRTNMSAFSTNLVDTGLLSTNPSPNPPTPLPTTLVPGVGACPNISAGMNVINWIRTGVNQTGKTWSFSAGMLLTFDPNTDNEETVQLQDVGGGVLGATFTKNHAANCTIINRGNPGPWVGYDRTKDRDVVPYAEIIE